MRCAFLLAAGCKDRPPPAPASALAVELDLRDASKPKASFEKKWTESSLGFAQEGGKWVVGGACAT